MSTCDKADCKCNARWRAFCDHWHVDEQPVGELERKSIEHWQQLQPHVRRQCVMRMREVGNGSPGVLERWKRQAMSGLVIGSDDIRFHMGVGMHVRNLLRHVWPDSNLPSVVQPNGEVASNWDDYYYGALDAYARGNDE